MEQPVTMWASSILESVLLTAKQRNEFFDALFYDVGSLSDEEKEQLSPLSQSEGSIILVSPRSKNRGIKEYPSVQSFLSADVNAVKGLVVAGVGSSVLGTAALARNIANTYHIEVAGIVSGYGAADLVSEAVGGWFFYGAADALKHQLRNRFDGLDTLFNIHPFNIHPLWEHIKKVVSLEAVTKPADLDAALNILLSDHLDLSLVVGHSKGNLILDAALEQFNKITSNQQHKYFNSLHIISLGAIIDFPPKFTNTHQFIGEMDWFGALNSRFNLEHTRVSDTGHHLNTATPFSMNVEHLLGKQLPLNLA